MFNHQYTTSVIPLYHYPQFPTYPIYAPLAETKNVIYITYANRMANEVIKNYLSRKFFLLSHNGVLKFIV